MKKINNVLAYFICFTAFIVLFITILDLVSFDINFYKKEYQKLSIAQTIKISDDDLIRVTNHLLDYIKGNNDDLTITAVIDNQERTVFNNREVLHMIDVKILYTFFINLRNVLLVLMIIIYLYLSVNKYSKLLLADIFIKVSKMYLILILGLSFYALIDFESFWLNFHYLFFDNELFFLNPNTDILIMMVPLRFFIDLVVKIIVFYALCVAVLLISAFKLRRNKLDKYCII